jgi:hypothetical protein
MFPNGQAATRIRHVMQRDRTISIAPVAALRTKAAVGQTWTHAASSHWKQVIGVPTSGPRRKMLIRVFDGRPSLPCAKAHASSHLPQAMHRSTETL